MTTLTGKISGGFEGVEVESRDVRRGAAAGDVKPASGFVRVNVIEAASPAGFSGLDDLVGPVLSQGEDCHGDESERE